MKWKLVVCWLAFPALLPLLIAPPASAEETMEKYVETRTTCESQVEFRIRYEIYDTEQGQVTEVWYDSWRFDRVLSWDEQTALDCPYTGQPDDNYSDNAPESQYVMELTDPDSDRAAASSFSAQASSGDLELPRFGSGATVVVNDNVLEKVTNYHKVPGWLVGKTIGYGVRASFPVRNVGYTPYSYRVWEYLCNEARCIRGTRNVYVRWVMDWNDGVANHGNLVTMYCKTSKGVTCPTWVRELPPYLGPPGPQ